MSLICPSHRSQLLLAVLSIASLSYGCGVDAILHDADPAAKGALKFASVVLIKQDFETGYSLLAETTQTQVPREQMITMTKQMHPDGFPVKVTIHEYEPIPGAEAMIIFAEGEKADERFHYRIIMKGTARKGYKVDGLFRDKVSVVRSPLRDSLSARLYAL